MKSLSLGLLLAIFTLSYTKSYGGAFFIDRSTVRLNGKGCGESFTAFQEITMSYRADGYSFSGGRDRYEFFLFAFLNKSTGEKLYALQLARDYSLSESNAHWFSLHFKLPTGQYKILYYHVPIFTNDLNLQLLADRTISNKDLRYHFNKNYDDPAEFSDLCQININWGNVNQTEAVAIYLRLNGEIPGTKKIDSTFKKIDFSFLPQNITVEKHLLYRYRLMPDESWSNWQTDNHANYYFINRGYHDFEVQCKYEKNGIVDSSRNSAYYHFNLEETFISNPDVSLEYRSGEELSFIDKGDVKRITVQPDIILSHVYDRSKALMIGVEKFSDPSFEVLPYIRNDVNGFSKALSNINFEIHKSNHDSRMDIMKDIRNELSNAKKNDRLIIYISSHGFIDPISKKPLIATRECKKANPVDAISIEELKDLIKGSSGNCRHILLILDCCASGLSIIEKNNSLGAIRTLATQNGTSILTAGMSDQNARMYEDYKMSVFTHFLIEGLTKKNADYTKDGIITLTELLIYVQYNVAKKTDSQQVPMSGRISGTGEMIFY